MSEEKRTITIDNQQYDLDSLSDKAKAIIGFVRRIDSELADAKYTIDRGVLARKQAVSDLKSELNDSEKTTKLDS
jgi:hypothetical protein